jgi:alpha-ribazole phosphatase
MGERVLFGQEDVQLSAEGLRQGECLAEWLWATQPAPCRVFASDLSRCRVLGARVAELHGLTLELAPELREQHLGDWQGRTWEAITAQDPELVREYWRDYVGARPPNGESFRDVAERVRRWWSDRAAADQGQRLVVVTHVGVLRALLVTWLGIPLDQALRLAPATGTHTAVTLSEAGGVLESFGERPWLRPLPRPHTDHQI